jgi:hypothetical protein
VLGEERLLDGLRLDTVDTEHRGGVGREIVIVVMGELDCRFENTGDNLHPGALVEMLVVAVPRFVVDPICGVPEVIEVCLWVLNYRIFEEMCICVAVCKLVGICCAESSLFSFGLAKVGLDHAWIEGRTEQIPYL